MCFYILFHSGSYYVPQFFPSIYQSINKKTWHLASSNNVLNDGESVLPLHPPLIKRQSH